jgi:D-alanine-D-alanine ligase
MRIGLAYNQKPDTSPSLDEPPSTSDAYAEWDDPATIDAVAQALSLLGDVVRLEAVASFPAELTRTRPDLVFNMAEGLHGVNRESHVPAMCEFLGVPYTGSDPLTLALALHKGRAKEVLRARGVPTAPFAQVDRIGDADGIELPYPLFVKPVAEGSGKGIYVNNLCDSPQRLRERLLLLLEEYRQPVLVEAYLPGREFTVAILGNGASARCLPIVGFDFTTLPAGAPPIYGYEAKWVWDTAEHQLAIFECPADIPLALARDIERVALAGFHALGCRDWCRADIRLDAAGVPNVVELNPLPGILPDPKLNSCFPKAARAAGYGYDEMIHEVVDVAWRRITGRELPGKRRGARAPHPQPAVRVPQSA